MAMPRATRRERRGKENMELLLNVVRDFYEGSEGEGPLTQLEIVKKYNEVTSQSMVSRMLDDDCGADDERGLALRSRIVRELERHAVEWVQGGAAQRRIGIGIAERVGGCEAVRTGEAPARRIRDVLRPCSRMPRTSASSATCDAGRDRRA